MSELDRKELLMAAMEQAEDGTLEAPEEREIEVDDDPIRNEKGQFAAKETAQNEAPEEIAETEATAEESEVTEEQEYTPVVARPTTWKKEYLPLWDKLDKGEALSQNEARSLLQYNVQRENEFKKGVSAYKAEADNARSLTEAISPFIPELQKNGIHPAAWINNLGRAHMILSQAPYQQKVELFGKLAQDYGIDLNSAYSGENTTQYQDPQSVALKQQIDYLNQQVQQVSSWREQQEQSVLMSEIQRFSSDADKHPHFEAVREQMAQLLENGLANDLETAYAKAVRLNDEVWQSEQNRLLQSATKQATQAQRVAKAKAAAVSPKSVTPNSQSGQGGAKDRRSILAEQMGELGNRV
jgi:pantothenate kinase-related protein Tda10